MSTSRRLARCPHVPRPRLARGRPPGLAVTPPVPALLLAMSALIAVPMPAAAQATTGYDAATSGTRRLVGADGLSIRILVEASNLGGGEVELGEITFPPGSGAGDASHTHPRVEIFYILEGTFDHIVNGEAHRLEPGMVGIVRPGDGVIHRVVGDDPVRALVVWAPGGEADRLASFFEERPLDDPPSDPGRG